MLGILERGYKLPQLWDMVVTNYTRRHLTFAKDKLPALGGIALELHQQTGDEYMAGIWRSQLPLALMWNTRKAASRLLSNNRSVEYRAPSWSWACIDGLIDFETSTSDLPLEPENTVKILNVNITTAGPNPFGEVVHGSINIEGRLKIVECGNEKEMGEGPTQDTHRF